MLKNLYFLIAYKKIIFCLIYDYCYRARSDDAQYERTSDNDLITTVRNENHQIPR
jgi:hypothetical protein